MRLKKLAPLLFILISLTLVTAVYQYVTLSGQITYNDRTNEIVNDLNSRILELMMMSGEPLPSDIRAYRSGWLSNKEEIDRGLQRLKAESGSGYHNDFRRIRAMSASLDSTMNELSADRGEARHVLMTKMFSITGELYHAVSLLHSSIHRSHNVAVRSIFIRFQIILAVLAVLIIGMCLIIWRRVLKPIFTLSMTLPENVKNGSYSGIEWNRDDEIGTLVRSVNQTFSLLEKANNSKQVFIAGMNHELKTPLNGIIGMSQSLMDEELTAGQKKSVGIINQSAISLLAILNDILLVSKFSGEGIVLSEQDFTIHDVFSRLRDVFQESADDKKLKLSFEVDSGIPQCLTGDSLHIEQVLRIIINNAVKFTDSGSVGVHAGMEELSNGRAVIVFDVADTGIGISRDDIARLAGYFTQLDGGTNRMREGTGLGLFIANRIASLMGGEISISSEPGHGSVFSFRISLKVRQNACRYGGYTEQVLDAEQGLRRLSGNRPLYEKLLATFIDTEKDRHKELPDALEHDGETALRIVHSLKSASAGIGAMRLRNVSADIETLLRSGSHVPVESVDMFAEVMDETLTAIRNMLPETEGKTAEYDGHDGLPDGYRKLITAVEANDAEALDMIDDVLGRASGKYYTLLIKAREKLNLFDFKAAGIILQSNDINDD